MKKTLNLAAAALCALLAIAGMALMDTDGTDGAPRVVSADGEVMQAFDSLRAPAAVGAAGGSNASAFRKGERAS